MSTTLYKLERDYKVNPFIVIWEVTRACALKCLHCRAEAQYKADPRQLTLAEGKRLIDEIAAMDRPLFVFTGIWRYFYCFSLSSLTQPAAGQRASSRKRKFA